jgi:hypothetical protein
MQSSTLFSFVHILTSRLRPVLYMIFSFSILQDSLRKVLISWVSEKSTIFLFLNGNNPRDLPNISLEFVKLNGQPFSADMTRLFSYFNQLKYMF